METAITMKIRNVIETAEKFRNSYFWSAPGSAPSRRYYEAQNSIDQFSWEDGKDTFTAEYTVICSCKNVYASGEYTRNGKKTTLTAVKNSLKRLTAQEGHNNENKRAVDTDYRQTQ